MTQRIARRLIFFVAPAVLTFMAGWVFAQQGAPVQGAEPDIALVTRFDRNGDKVLDYVERNGAREYLTAHPEIRGVFWGQGGSTGLRRQLYPMSQKFLSTFITPWKETSSFAMRSIK